MEWANREMERKVNEKVLSAQSGRVVSRTHFQTVFVGQYEKKHTHIHSIAQFIHWHANRSPFLVSTLVKEMPEME